MFMLKLNITEPVRGTSISLPSHSGVIFPKHSPERLNLF